MAERHANEGLMGSGGNRYKGSSWVLGLGNKSEGKSVATTMGMRFKTTCMQLHPREKGQYHTCQKVRTIVTRTVSWKVCKGRLRSWSWTQGTKAEGGLHLRDYHMIITRWTVIQRDHITVTTLGSQGKGQASLEIKIQYLQEEKGRGVEMLPWTPWAEN